MTLSELIFAIRQLSPTDKLELFLILKAELDNNQKTKHHPLREDARY